MAMPETVSVYYERKLSDGQYGSEGLSLGLTMSLNDSEPAEELLNDGTVHGIASRIRRAVLTELAASEAPRVAAVAQSELDALNRG